MRHQLGPLGEQLERTYRVSYPDAPHKCSEQTVERLWKSYRPPRGVETPRAWWNASDDRLVYSGWRASVERLVPELAASERTFLVGFSQGASFAALLAGLAFAGEVPALAGVVLIAGARPRASDLTRYFQRQISVPSLHLIATQDVLMKDAPRKLSDCFDPEQRTVVEFAAGHVVPRRGPAAQALLQFLEDYSGK